MAENESGVLRVAQLRIRPGGPTLFVSLVVEVPRTMPVDSMVRLKDSLTAGVLKLHPKADVLVTTNPVAIDSETVFDKISLIASRRGTSIHHLTVQQIGDRLAVSFDLEVDGATPLDEAHELATGLERAVRLELGPTVEVETHIEPQPVRLLEGHAAPAATVAAVERTLRSLAKGVKRMSDVHNVRVRSIEDGLFVHYHCRFAPNERVDYVHAAVDGLEDSLRTAFPHIVRVIAHAEPVGRPRHEL
jgi:divalent metal cation (Fe/Co/Zn/Cd) transporter